MKRNQIIGSLLIFGILIGFMVLNSPSKEELAKKKAKQDSLNIVQKKQDSLNLIKIAEQQALINDSIKKADSILTDTIVANDSLINANLVDNYGVFAGAAEGDTLDYIIENDLVRLTISSLGGFIKQAELKEFKTYDQQPLLFFGKSNSFGFSFFLNNRQIKTNQLFFEPVYYGANPSSKGAALSIGSADSLVFGMRLLTMTDSTQKPASIEFRYILRKGEYMIDFDVVFDGMEKVLSNTTVLNLDWKTDLRRHEKSIENERTSSTVYYKFVDDDVDNLSESRADKESLKTKVEWISFKQQFFSATIISIGGMNDAEVETFEVDENNQELLKSMAASMSFAYDANATKKLDLQIYLGPNKYKTLRGYDRDLERQIPLGWSFAPLAWINRYAVIPVFNWLETYNLGYGIIILILTILLKIVLFPIAYKTYYNSAKMRVLKPEIEEISQKFPKKEDAMKKQQATMALYKKAGVNPMSGCIPMLLQFPILIAMFRFFPASIELRQEAFLWADDLSAYDSVLNLGFNIPFYGDHVSLFCLLMTISTIIYTKLNNDMMGSTNTMPGMKTMMYLMPIMFLGFFNSYASGLSYYYLLANFITFAQMFAFRRFINEGKILAKIAENKKRPIQKSRFQQRLEEAAKKRGVK